MLQQPAAVGIGGGDLQMCNPNGRFWHGQNRFGKYD